MRYRGKCICIAGEELFVADMSEEVLALATAACPEDDGHFLHYIPGEKVTRIYANAWGVVSRSRTIRDCRSSTKMQCFLGSTGLYEVDNIVPGTGAVG